MIRITEGPTRLTLRGDERDLKYLARSMRVRPKGFEHAPSYKAFQATDGQDGWDGFICAIRILDPNNADCLRGYKDALLALCSKHDIQVDTTRCLRSPFENLTTDDIPDNVIASEFDLDQYQREAVVYWLKHGMGVNKIAVNGGKTAMFAAAASMIKRRFPKDRVLYVTQSERLVRQAYRDITGFMPGYDITQYGGGKKNNTGKDLVIATVAMIAKNWMELKHQGWFDDFIALLYDESHHAGADTSTKLIMKLPAFFRLGASDTKHESDEAKMMKIHGLLGPIRYTVTANTYIEMGRSAKPTIYLVRNPAWHNRFSNVPHQAEPGTKAWALVGKEWRKGIYLGPVYERDANGKVVTRMVRELEGVNENEVHDGSGQVAISKTARWVEVEKPVTLDGFHQIRFEDCEDAFDVDSRYCLLKRTIDKAIITFKDRNELIRDWVKFYSIDKGYPTLVVCTRTIHVLILETILKEAVGEDKVRILFSEHTSRERDEAFDWFRNSTGGVLVSPLIKEGVSINQLRAGVIADYVGDWEVMNQIIGRFIRKKEGVNEAFITAFIDVQHPSLRKGSRRVFNKLYNIRGFDFYHPCLGPDSIAEATKFGKLD